MPEFIEANNPGCKADYILFNNVSELPVDPPNPIGDYDFQIVQIATRSILQEHHYFRLRYEDASAYEDLFETIRDNLSRVLETALSYNKNHGLLTFASNFMVPQQNAMGRLLPRYDLRNPVYFFEQLNVALAAELRQYKNVHLLDIDLISASVGRKYVQDDAVWSFAHNAALSDVDYAGDQQRIEPVRPMSEHYELRTYEFVQAMWGEIIALYRTIRQTDAVKLVVVDLDDTLWRGVMAERDSPSWDAIEGWPLGFAEALLYLKRRGVLLAILSKNDEGNIRRIWNEVFHGLLSLDDFAVRKIDWNSKVENLDDVIASVNVLPRSVVYIDDNPVEREAMRQAFPDLRVLGSEPYSFKRVLLWAPETQVAFITEESGRRTEMVQQGAQRETARKRMSREEFLASLNLRIGVRTIRDDRDAAFPRAFELLNKTNQFNTTGQRWKLEEARGEFARGGVWYGFEVEDKFTKYGLVALALMNGAEMVQFVMSCRVVGLGVEMAAFAAISNIIGQSDSGQIIGRIFDTKANALAFNFLKSLNIDHNGEIWKLNLGTLPLPPNHIKTEHFQAAI